MSDSGYDDEDGDAAQMLGGTNDWLMKIAMTLGYIAFLMTIIAICSMVSCSRGH